MISQQLSFTLYKHRYSWFSQLSYGKYPNSTAYPLAIAWSSAAFDTRVDAVEDALNMLASAATTTALGVDQQVYDDMADLLFPYSNLADHWTGVTIQADDQGDLQYYVGNAPVGNPMTLNKAVPPRLQNTVTYRNLTLNPEPPDLLDLIPF